MESLKVRRTQKDVLQTVRDHGGQPRLLYPAKLSTTIDGEKKTFHEIANLSNTYKFNPTEGNKRKTSDKRS